MQTAGVYPTSLGLIKISPDTRKCSVVPACKTSVPAAVPCIWNQMMTHLRLPPYTYSKIILLSKGLGLESYVLVFRYVHHHLVPKNAINIDSNRTLVLAFNKFIISRQAPTHSNPYWKQVPKYQPCSQRPLVPI